MLSFQDLYNSYAHEVFRFAYWLSGSVAEAEDITSETFVRAWTHIDTIRTETLKAYLMTIARNLYLGQLRKRKRETELDHTLPDPNPGPEKIAEDRAEVAMIQRYLLTIPEIDRTAFVLRVQHKFPYAEIGRVLQISESAAKVKVHRARKKLLKARLSEEV
jgi:RNA polymerase sigma-70 factor (ECF subfamily)